MTCAQHACSTPARHGTKWLNRQAATVSSCYNAAGDRHTGRPEEGAPHSSRQVVKAPPAGARGPAPSPPAASAGSLSSSHTPQQHSTHLGPLCTASVNPATWMCRTSATHVTCRTRTNLGTTQNHSGRARVHTFCSVLNRLSNNTVVGVMRSTEMRQH